MTPIRRLTSRGAAFSSPSPSRGSNDLLVWQVPAEELNDVSRKMRDAFTITREAIESDQPAVLVVDPPNLLGQGTHRGSRLSGIATIKAPDLARGYSERDCRLLMIDHQHAILR